MIFFRSADQSSLQGLPLLFAILLTIRPLALSQESPPDKPQIETVRGTVMNAVTGAPIPRALVFTRDNRVATLTDGEGHFEMTVPKQGGFMGSVFSFDGPVPARPRIYQEHGRSVMLSARKPGFLEDVSAQMSLAPSSSDDITIALSPEAIIKGRITVASGDAALGIRAQLFSRQVQDGYPRWMQGPSVTANSSGEFRFAELRAGSYKLVTSEFMDNDPITNIPGSQPYGYPPVYYPGVSEFSSASTIELTAGQELQADLSLVRQPYYPVRIPITNNDVGQGMNISVKGERGPGYALGYNAGEQRIDGLLPNGNYIVEASTFGQHSMTGSVSLRVTGAPAEGAAMTLVPGSSITLDIREEFSDTTSTISGSWSDGKHTFSYHGPRAYLQANVESVDDLAQQRFGSIRPPTKPNDENLVIENLAPGRYWLRLHTGRGYIASATQGATDLLRQPLTVGSGPGAPIEIRVRDDTAELDGTVIPLAQQATLNAEAAEPAQVWVYCVPQPDSSGEFTQLGVSGDGEFTNPRMAPGDYRILAFYREHSQLPYRDPEAMKAYESKGPVVHLAAGQKVTIQVQTISKE
jgi:hypothetical protein